MRRHLLLVTMPMLAACAAEGVQTSSDVASNAPNDCFYGSQVSGFTEGGPDQALVRIGFREGWALTLSPGCPNVDFAMNLGIVSRGSDRICAGRPAELLVPRASGSGFQRCLVSNVRRMSEQEIAAAWGQQP